MEEEKYREISNGLWDALEAIHTVKRCFHGMRRPLFTDVQLTDLSKCCADLRMTLRWLQAEITQCKDDVARTKLASAIAGAQVVESMVTKAMEAGNG